MSINARSGILLGVAGLAVAAIAGTVIYNVVGNSESSDSNTITWWVPDWDHDAAIEAVADFEAQNSGLTVELVTTTGDTVANRVSVALDSGNTPDVITDSISRVRGYVENDQLADVSSLYDEEMPVDDFAPGLVESLTFDGATYAVPYRWATNALIYNPDILAEAGYDAPPATWAEFEEISLAVTQGDVVGTAWPMQGDPRDLTLRFLDFAVSAGASIDDGTPHLTPESSQAALEIMGESIVDGWASASSFELDNTGIRELFLQGRIAMYPGGMFDAEEALAQGAPVGTALLPGPDGPGIAQGVGWTYIVPAEAPNPEGAQALVSFLGQSEYMASITETFPARKTASQDERFSSPEQVAFAEQLAEYSTPAPNDPNWTAAIQTVHDEIQRVALGQSTSAEAAQVIQDLVDQGQGN